MALLVIITAAVYAPLRDAAFINLDDPGYVQNNDYVNQGFTAESLAWAFSVDRVPSGYHPLTQLSYMLDVAMFGAGDAGKHHLMNVAYHLIAVVLMYVFMLRLTEMPGRSLFVTAVFALHPAHVESVAWIAERKDVVSVVFGLLTLCLYLGYARKPSVGWYAAVVISFTLALLGKPMMVTLPMVMLLLDYWPLERLPGRQVWLEKLPLFALAGVSGVLTVMTQKHMGAVADATFPLSLRAALATVAVGYEYLCMTLIPHDLAVYYPPHFPAAWKIALASLVIVAVTMVCVMQRRAKPYLLVGWLWYVVTLLPVLGLLRAGGQAMADRYTYLSMTGLVIAVVWLICDLRVPIQLLRIAACAVVIAMSATAYAQVGHWRDSITLFAHTVAVTDDNAMALNRLADALERRGKWPEAYAAYVELSKLKPDDPSALLGLGFAAGKTGHDAQAVAAYRKLLTVEPQHLTGNYRLAMLLARQGDAAGAADHLRIVTRLRPQFADGYNNLGVMLMQLGKRAEAVAAFTAAVNADPNHERARINLEHAKGDSDAP